VEPVKGRRKKGRDSKADSARSGQELRRRGPRSAEMTPSLPPLADGRRKIAWELNRFDRNAESAGLGAQVALPVLTRRASPSASRLASAHVRHPDQFCSPAHLHRPGRRGRGAAWVRRQRGRCRRRVHGSGRFRRRGVGSGVGRRRRWCRRHAPSDRCRFTPPGPLHDRSHRPDRSGASAGRAIIDRFGSRFAGRHGGARDLT
jgi:hypothetical protein